ncbi:MAG: ATP-binding protein [Phycisphaerae bacterium]|nr:ATP-binding protein [Phycisphaerae bacterium]
MIKRLYIDNYKCMVNFEYKPSALELLFGENGTGKSTVFEVLSKLRDFLLGKPTRETFLSSSLTAWQTRPEQTFELDVEYTGTAYNYKLVIEHDRAKDQARMREETLSVQDNVLYRFDGESAHLFRDNHLARLLHAEQSVFPHDGSRSGLATIPDKDEHRRLMVFRMLVARILVLAIEPGRMETVSHAEQRLPDSTLSNFASWYRHHTQESPEVMAPLFESLKHVIDGFTGLKLTSMVDQSRALRAGFKSSDDQTTGPMEFYLGFDELSTGQKCLIALFTILHCAVRSDFTICIDEPDNFVALRELQPWLTELCDRVEEQSGQCLIISHHPEFIDLLAVKHGTRFTRSGVGPVRLKPFDWSQADGVRPSELVARGWEE